MMGSKTQGTPEFQIITGFFLFDSLQLGGGRVGGWRPRASGIYSQPVPVGKRLDYQGVGSRPRISVWPARASPKGQGACRCPAREATPRRADSRSAQSAPTLPPTPSCFPRRPQGTVDYEAAFICLLGDDGGQGDQDPHPLYLSSPAFLQKSSQGQSSQSLYPEFKV